MRIDARCLVAEGTGTFFLVFAGPGAAVVDAASGGAIGHAGVALASGFVVLAMIYALGHLSGAHINPAVTLGFWAMGRFPGRWVVPYMVVQCAGAVLAAFALSGITGPVSAAATVPSIHLPGALGLEWLLSFALMLVIAAVATDDRVTDGFAALAVGLTVGFGVMMGGPLTGASMNPARSLGPAVTAGVWDAHWLYWLAPLSAMPLAARVYEFLRPAAAPGATPRGVPTGVQGPI